MNRESYRQHGTTERPLWRGDRAAMDLKPHLVFLDLEAKRPPEEVGGWGHIRKMGLSIAVTLAPSSGELRLFEEGEVEGLVELLNAAGRVVGFNCRRFHFQIIRGLVGRSFRPRASTDLLVEFRRATGHRIVLESLMAGTFGLERKVGRLELMEWQRLGKKSKLAGGLCQRVLDLERLHEHLKQTGKLWFVDPGGSRVAVRMEEICES